MELLPVNGEEPPQDIGENAGCETFAEFVLTMLRPGVGFCAQSVFFQPLKYVTFSTGRRFAGLKSSPV